MSRPSSSSPLLDAGGLRKKHWTPPLVVCVLICCLASIQYGFHMSELNAPAKYIRLSLGISQSQLGFATAIFSIGGLVSSTFASYISTNYGLKPSFIVTSVCYVLGSFIESRAGSHSSLLLGRFVSGLGGGLAIVYVPIYVNDVSPVELRGILGSMTQISVNFGILLAQMLAMRWNSVESWRRILSVGWIIAGVNVVLAATSLVESPKWLVIRSKHADEALGTKILGSLRGSTSSVQDVHNEIEIWKVEKQGHLLLLESSPHLKNLGFWCYLTDKNYFNSKTIATFMMIGQQFAGINSVIFYGVDILNKVFPQYAVLANVLISVGNMVITAVSSTFLDRVGRKPLLLLSLLSMLLSLLVLSAGILTDKPLLTVVSIFTYVGSFAIGCGPIPFLIVSEVSQVEVKDIAQSWATDCNWVSVFVVGTMFPILNTLLGGWVYLIFAAVCVLFAVFVHNFVPETKGCATYDEVWAATGTGTGAGNRID